MSSYKYAIAPFVDVYNLNDQEIQIRLLAKNESDTITIEGDGVGDLLMILWAVYLRPMALDEIFYELELKSPKVDCQKVLENLVDLGALSHCVQTGQEPMTDLLVPYQLTPILNGRYVCIRNTQYIYISPEEQGSILTQAALSQSIDQEDVDIALCLTQHGLTYDCLPSKNVTIDSLGLCKHLPVNCRLSFDGQGKLRFAFPILAKVADNQSDERWKTLLSKGLQSNIVSTVQRIETKTWALKPSGIIYQATHRIHDLKQAHDDFQLGIGATDFEACGKAVMEALERYSGRVPHQQIDGVVYSKKEDLEGGFIDIGKLAKYSAMQFQGDVTPRGIQLPQDGNKTYWIRVNDVYGDQTYAPANFIFYSFRADDFTGGKNTFWSNSNGIAAHLDFDKAVISAVLETIERDAILIWWLNRLAPPKIELDSLDVWTKSEIQKVSKLGFEVAVLDITLDTLPAALVVARNKRNEWPYFFCGAACSIKFIDAVRKALQEMLLSMGNEMSVDSSHRAAKNKFTISQPMDHARLYYDPAMSGVVSFLFEGKISRVVDYPSQDIHTAIAANHYLRQRGFELWYLDITPPEIAEFNLDIVVVKVIIPNMVPISFGYMSEPLGMDRITDLPFQLGIVNKKTTVNDLLKDYMPHFFP